MSIDFNDRFKWFTDSSCQEFLENFLSDRFENVRKDKLTLADHKLP